MDTRTDELAAFKTRINLTAYAASYGYKLDVKASCRTSAKMRHPDGSIIVIGMDGSTWVYFSVSDDHSGTIIDFVQHRDGVNLGLVRKRLRPWLGHTPTPPTALPSAAYVKQLDPAPKDQLAVLAAYEAAERVEGFHPYLSGDRGIPASLVASLSETADIRTDNRGNVLFPHYDIDGVLVGFELKNQGFTGFSPGGKKALWGSRKNEGDSTLVIAETAIDALSYMALKGDETTRCVSIAGQMNPQQPAQLVAEIQKLSKGGRVVMALDHDEGGDKIAEQLADVYAAAERIDLQLIDDRPPTPGSDWNDELLANPPTPLLTDSRSPQPIGGGRSEPEPE